MGKEKKKLTKTTVLLPEALLKRAQAVSGEGITPTIRMALELLAARKSYDSLLGLQGKFQSSLDLKTLRED